jgi:hypothetical protein
MVKLILIFAGLMVFSISMVLGQEDPNPIILQNAIQDFTENSGSKINTGSFLPVFSHKEETKGTRYLFDNWVHGSVVSANNYVLDSNNYLYNYDKISHHLFLTKDKKHVIEVNNVEFKSFTLKRDDQEYAFKHIDLINQTEFFQELVNKPGKYSLYKSIHTRIKRANYYTNGLFENGNDYDEYVDNFDYYVIFPDGRIYKQIKLRMKSIKDVLSMEKTKMKAYFSIHWENPIDEEFLKGLITYLDQ